MTKTRIKALREGRGMSQEQLAKAIGRTKSVISRIESGETGLDLAVAQKIADELNVPLSEVLGISSDPSIGFGFREDIVPYKTAADDPIAKGLGPNEYLWIVDTDVCENAGIRRGFVVTVNDSAAAVANVSALDIVIAMYHHPEAPEKAVRLLRQFVPPSLLITNAGATNARSINIAKEDAQIISVVTGVHRRNFKSSAH